jgi:hypothetical protein
MDTKPSPTPDGADDSRSRAYQLIRFVQTRRRAAMEGGPMPANERQSRAPKAGANPPDTFEGRWTPVYNYLLKTFRNFPSSEHLRFLKMLEVTLIFLRDQGSNITRQN